LILKMSSLEEQSLLEEPLPPIGMKNLGLAGSFVTPSPKKGDGCSNRFINEDHFINERKPLSTTVEKTHLTTGEHTLIPVTAKMINSAM
jgi:hypothetical protein